MKKIKVATGIIWLEIPKADLKILCGCPADSIKHLKRHGLIRTVEKNGVTFDTGPNAILLSDVPIQNEHLSNLAEFPVLQMLYFQGMLLPGHPNNTGRKPMLIGINDQLKAQADYIYHGNYGLTSIEEIIAAGIPEAEARDMMRIKLRFAFDKILETEELVETKAVGPAPVEIRGGAFVERKACNIYEFTCDGEKAVVDLNLAPGEDFEPAYHLGHHQLNREYFSVIHTGEGDGWDIHRPCMSSIVTFQGKIYLIDAGPNLMHSLVSLGIGVNEIEGIFHTHAHDDHFNGLTVLMRSDHKIKYFATPLVRKSVIEKLAALTIVDDDKFSQYFDVHDLQFDIWNNIDGLEVKPVYSPHPVETSVLFFRALWGGGYKTYLHLADTVSLDVLEGMVTDDPNKSGCSRGYFNSVREMYLTPVDLKKIDIGGGLIHGRAEDFRGDKSGRILLSHTCNPLTDVQKEIGDSTSFGMADVLIRADHDYTKPRAYQHLQIYFPGAPAHELRMLLNCPAKTFTPGTSIIKKGSTHDHVYFVLSGVLEFIVNELGINNRLTAGSLIGELSGILGNEAKGTYRAESFVKTLAIPCSLYIEFLIRNNLLEHARQNIAIRRFLQNTKIIGESISCPIKSMIAASMKSEALPEGQTLEHGEKPELILIEKGRIKICAGEKHVETIGPGGFFGEENIIRDTCCILKAIALKDSSLYRIPAEAVENIPIIRFKLLETLEKRMSAVDNPAAGQCGLKPGK